MEPDSDTLPRERERSERRYFWAIYVTLSVGVGMGVIGSYQGHKLNENQIRALKNHEIIISENERLIKIHAAAETTIQNFLNQERELVRYHSEYVKDNRETHRMLSEILNVLRNVSTGMRLQTKERP